MEEKDLVEGLKKRNNESFIELVDCYKKKITYLCYSYTQDHHEAEDLSQEVFINIYNCIHNFRGDSSLSTYIYKIALSRCMDYKRKKSIKGFLSGLFSFEKDAKENYDDIDERNYIRQTILALPEEMKRIIVLYYYVGLSQKEIGEILNIGAKAVEGRLYRAKHKLKLEFEKEGKFECSKSGII